MLEPMPIAALVAVLLLGVVAVFQAALALGAPWGAAAWGGGNPGVLPRPLRIASAVAALVVYPLLIVVVLAAAGIIDDGWMPIDPGAAMWALAILLGLGAVANAISRSPIERVWAPVALATAIACALVAIGA
jgi:hypothetical protein